MDIETVASFTCSASAVEIGEAVVRSLETDGHRCSRITEMDNSATFTTKVRRLSILVVVYPDGTDPDQWVVTLGPGVLPSSRLIGMTDTEQQTVIGQSIGSALDDMEDAGPVHWYTDEAWAVIRPPAPRSKKAKNERRRWWSRT